jgi:hypothetical protein
MGIGNSNLSDVERIKGISDAAEFSLIRRLFAS